jgi:myo-inositol-1(or 4)-monophosphatase
LSELSFPSFLEDASKKAVLEAGTIAKKLKKNILIKYKSEDQPVTNADIKIDNFLKSLLKKITPNYGWVSEETTDDKSRFSSEFFWCLDPIDGTRSYINDKPEYTISLALIKKNKPVLGIILNPETQELFFAIKDKGAYCNGKKINVSQNHNIFLSKYGISSSEIKKIQRYKCFNQDNIIKMGSIAYKIALVAKGEMDIAISFTKKNDWDLAASDLILEEAGGDLKNLSGKKIIYNSKEMQIDSVLASNDTLMEKLQKQFNE